MVRSEFNIGDFLYGIPSSKESEKHNPENQRVFIHTGYKNGDGYGVLIGWENGQIVRSSGSSNFMWGGKARLATASEIEEFMSAVRNQRELKHR